MEKIPNSWARQSRDYRGFVHNHPCPSMGDRSSRHFPVPSLGMVFRNVIQTLPSRAPCSHSFLPQVVSCRHLSLSTGTAPLLRGAHGMWDCPLPTSYPRGSCLRLESHMDGPVWMWLELKGRQKPCRKIKQLHVISWLCTERWECRNSHGILAEALGREKKGV